jgi:hypothetical protein
MKKLVIGALLTASSLALGSSALAGEITGGGPSGPKETPIKSRQDCPDPMGGNCPAPAGPAKSECAFSGLNDEYLFEQPEDGIASDGFGRTQSWGQIPKAIRDMIRPFASPGVSCNPHGGGHVEP